MSKDLLADPRLSMIPRKLSMFKYIASVINPKGGVGKTTIAVALALTLSRMYGKTALLDLDITNPTTHIVLGLKIDEVKIEEDKGILPMKIPGENLEFMSVAFFTKGRLLPLRGKGVVNVIRELLSITRWSSDILIVDTPPGFSDEIMEFSNLVPKMKYIVVSTPDPLSILSTQRVIELLYNKKQFIIGVVGNMCKEDQDLRFLLEGISSLGVEVLTCIPWINGIHRYYGKYSEFLNVFNQRIPLVVNRLISDML